MSEKSSATLTFESRIIFLNPAASPVLIMPVRTIESILSSKSDLINTLSGVDEKPVREDSQY